MKATELYDDIRTYCRANADPAVVRKYARYFTEGYDAYGLTREKLDEKVESILSDKKVDMKLVLSTARLLVKSGKHEETGFAIRLLRGFSGQFDGDTFSQIEKWFRLGIVNWGHCDALCGYLMPPLFANGVISLHDLSSWRRSRNTYQRRAVPVTLLTLLKATNHFTPLFKCIEPLMMDPERKVQQGLGWFLREAGKIRKRETERFLRKWKDEAPRTIFQYATEKMTAQEKRRFRKDKS